MSCRMAACPQSQRRKLAYFSEHTAWAGVRCTSSGWRQRCVEQARAQRIRYPLWTDESTSFEADLRLGFWIRICLYIGLKVCRSVCLSGTATFFFLPDALSVSWNNMFAVCFYILVSWSTSCFLVWKLKRRWRNHSSEKRLSMSYDMLLLETAWNRSEPFIPSAY